MWIIWSSALNLNWTLCYAHCSRPSKTSPLPYAWLRCGIFQSGYPRNPDSLGSQVDKLTTSSQDSHQGPPAAFPASVLWRKSKAWFLPLPSPDYLCPRKFKEAHLSMRTEVHRRWFSTEAIKTLKEFLPWRWKPLPPCDWRPSASGRWETPEVQLSLASSPSDLPGTQHRRWPCWWML